MRGVLVPGIAWCLEKPVHKYPVAHLEPLRYLKWVAEYYARTVGADPGYSGILAHNPAPCFRSPYRTTWGREEPYTLDQGERRRNNPPLKRPVDPAAADQNGTAYSPLSGLL